MAGLVKAKKYDWKDSNLALFGSDTERKVGHVIEWNCFNDGQRMIYTGEERVCRKRTSLEGRWSERWNPDLAHCKVQGDYLNTRD